MKTASRILSILLLVALLVGCLAGCTESQTPTTGVKPQAVDYASQLKLDMDTSKVKMEVTVKNFVDGDTVHFYADAAGFPDGVLKGRFLAINTPESTGRIEPYGKAASRYTKEALKDAESIIVESDSDKWELDSTGGRYLVWVWYKKAGMTEYRNLNLEILQNGLAVASNTAGNGYGDICVSALDQAKNLKLNVYSGEKDPEFYDGAAVELTLKELRTNIQSYADMSVAFECVITSNSQDTVYVEQFDEESQMYYGISVYYGNAGLTGDGLKILSIGNKARIVGKVQYYETGDTWQISGLKYRIMKPNDPENIQQIGTGFEPAYVLTDAETFVNGTKDVMVTDPETKEDVIKSFRYNALAMNTSLEMKNLVVKSAYTTNKEESASYGAISLTCEVDGKQITVRTVPLYDADGKLITQDTFIGKTIDVKGIMDYYDGEYQIKVFRPDQITIH
jgi:endonuclease YncB( thermonuclease family)